MSKIISIEISDEVYGLLEVLTKGEWSFCESVEDVVHELIDHAQQGVFRPGSWERPWLSQAFGDDWTACLEPDPRRVMPNSIGGHGRNGMPFDRPKQ
jgi:hypothetical protein